MLDTPMEPIAALPSPVDPRVALAGLWRRRGIALLLVVISLVVGVTAGRALGVGTYESEASLLYDPAVMRTVLGREPLPVPLIAARVRSTDVLKPVASALGTDLASLQRATESELDRDSGAIRIRAAAPSAEAAQRTARALSDAFVADVRATVTAACTAQLERLRADLNRCEAAAEQAESALQAFLVRNHLSASDMAAGDTPDAVEQLQLALTEAESERQAFERQLSMLESTRNDLLRKAREEARAARAAAHEGALEKRSQDLMSLISDNRSRSANLIALRQSEAELRRARQLAAEGYISQQELERAGEAVEKSRALLADDRRYDQWRSITATRAARPPVTTLSAAPSQAQLGQIESQAQTLRLQVDGLSRRTASLRLQHARALQRRVKLPALQRHYESLNRAVTSRRQDVTDASSRLEKTQQLVPSPSGEVPGLTLLTEASMPTAPLKSRKKLLAFLIGGAGAVLSLALVAFVEVRKNLLTVPPQIVSHLSVPLLGVIPRFSERALANGEKRIARLDLQALARQVRACVPPHGGQILLLSLLPSEGKTRVAQLLVPEFRRRRESVVFRESVAREETDLSRATANVDAVVLVIENGVHAIDELRLLVEDLRAVGAPLKGGIVTKVDAFYMAMEGALP